MSPSFPDGDPDSQLVTFYSRDGQVVSVDLYSIDLFYQYNVRLCINLGSQLGACVVLLVFLLLLTHSGKRGSSVFILNGLALLFNILRLLLQAIHFSTPFEKIYPFFSGDYSDVKPGAYAISILGVVFETMLVMCIMISLVVQVHVVCKTLRRRYRRPLLAFSVLVALVPIGFRMGWMVINCIYIMAVKSTNAFVWLQSAVNIVITISICFFCAIFVVKLGHAIKQRRRLGVRDFGPMKIIFVCGCQTLTIPALFSILQYFSQVPELADNVLTLVTLSLPLSSIWAGVALDNSQRIETPRIPRNLWRALNFGIGMSQSMPTNHPGTEMTATAYTGQTLCYADQQISKHSQDSEMPLAISVEHDISVDSVRCSGQNKSMV
jgi:pheromone alpha factor receptor